MPDHLHLLVDLARTVTVSDAVHDVKTATSRWIKVRKPGAQSFAWQNGYAAFAVSASNVEDVREYVANQAEHHRVRSFQEEYRGFLNKHGVAYDERYVWD